MKKIALSLILCASALGAKSGEKPPYSTETKSLARAITQEASKQGSRSLTTVSNSEKSSLAIDIGKRLSQLAGIDPQIRTVIGRNIPTAIGNLEIVLPSAGLAKYSDNQLQFVMAHEIAHIVLDHATARIEYAVAACTPFTDIEQLMSCVRNQLSEKGDIREELNTLTKYQELEADIWATQFLTKHGIASDIPGALKAAHIDAPWYSKSHPPLSQRLQQIKDFCEKSNCKFAEPVTVQKSH